MSEYRKNKEKEIIENIILKKKWECNLSDFKLFLISQIILLLVIISFYINHNFF